jgi:hypothetical protein
MIHQYEKDGLRFSHSDELGDFLIVESAKLPQTVEYIRTQGATQLYLNWQLGFTFKSLRFLHGVEHLITGLEMVVEQIDLEGIERCVNLRTLLFSDDLAQPIAFECFPNLAYCSIHWNKPYRHATFPPSLTELHIRAYQPQVGFNEASLRNLRQVTKLHLLQGSGQDLSLLHSCGPLTHLAIAYGRALTDISALAAHADTLQRVDLDKCKKISDFSPLGQLRKLQWLNLCDCKRIPSLSFVKQLPELAHFVFYGTVVEDGDLSFLQGLKQVAFTNKPHYSLKQQDFEYVWGK